MVSLKQQTSVLSLTITLMIVGACNAAETHPRVYIDLWNRMPQGKELTANCNDSGNKGAGKDVAIQYELAPYAGGGTVKIHCLLVSVYGQLIFDAWDLNKDDSKHCEKQGKCGWDVSEDGAHATINDVADKTFYPWVPIGRV